MLRLLNLRKRVLGPEHPETLWSMHNLAISYGNLGQFNEAADLHAKTLNLRTTVLGTSHPMTLLSKNDVKEANAHLARLSPHSLIKS